MSKLNAHRIIDLLQLEPLNVEGGYYRETYRAEGAIQAVALPPFYTGSRNYCTAIYYMLTPDTCSRMHRVKSDEIFHFYLGDPVLMLQLQEKGKAQTLTLGNDIESGHAIQTVVPHGVMQGAMLAPGGEFALMGCTVAPGFEYEDFEIGRREALIKDFPEQRELIEKLTAPDKA